jgi:hypothetical protein
MEIPPRNRGLRLHGLDRISTESTRPAHGGTPGERGFSDGHVAWPRLAFGHG